MPSPPLFLLSSCTSKFGPRTGRFALYREEGPPSLNLQLDTPALLAATSRGVIPHLSRDNLHLTETIKHIQLQFESFLDKNPPVPTLVAASHPSHTLNPLHAFLGYSPDRHVIVLTLRNPSDGRVMPPNGNDFVNAYCTRGVRQVNIAAWKAFVHSCKPDMVLALSDTPFTPPPHSQKRLTKSIDRSINWLADFLKVPPAETDPTPTRRNVLVHLAGGIDTHARAEFSNRLTEPIEQKDAEGLAPFNTLDDGVAGYVSDLMPLRGALAAEAYPSQPKESKPTHTSLRVGNSERSSSKSSAAIVKLLRASLENLPVGKPRIINSSVSPHEILRLVRDVGVDVIDSVWAQRAADIGIALDFCFPIPDIPVVETCPPPRTRESGKTDLGHNLFDSVYLHDRSRLASTFLDGRSAEQTGTTGLPVCQCGACTPRSPASRLLHSSVDIHAWKDPPSVLQPPFVRSYIHHLLHTHEMSSHSLLVMHNLTIFSNFLAGIRNVLSRVDDAAEEFAREVERFEQMYDEEMVVWDEAQKTWFDVEQARGKGRIAREKKVASTVGTVVDL